MDWGRTKSVLILAFLLLNMLLGYQLWLNWQERIDSAVDWTSLPPETQQVMQEKSIKVEAQIPTETPAMQEITYKLEREGSGNVIPIDPPRDSRIVFVEQELKQELGGIIPDLDKYRYDNWASREGVFVLDRTEGGRPIFDVQLELHYSNQKINGYTQDIISILPSEGGSAQKVLPAAKVVKNLIENYLPAGSIIKEIQLGYHGQTIFDSETQVAAPSWRVLLEDGEVYYVHAISSEVVTDKSDAAKSQGADGGGS
ncbi:MULTISPECIES: two-component system regulatory protein YycI [Cohnella]|jgi:regulatory protein YycI of two-component signal transduction system YycFG|uniref:two-component system regulatory protein YycI n=1 Tax=Cohnella TaxID=329857 RepID=UPI00037CF9CD|nr:MULTISPECIES: two-component system regulatory protein YycI [Cohnella]REK68757.1 MAG: hypothetical protein C6P35_00240 [Cohnella sp.]